MPAYNVVRFRVKQDREADFEQAIRTEMRGGYEGLKHAALIKTGDREYCEIGEWDSFDSIVNARPAMIAVLDSVRNMLEDLGDGLGVTDAVSGEAVVEFGPAERDGGASGITARTPQETPS